MEYLKLMRVKHYLKNVLVLLPLFFSGKIFEKGYLYIGLLGFLLFSFTSSVVYIINDIKDIEKDRKHPTKKNRPLAKGTISIKQAVILAFLLVFIIVMISIFLIQNQFSIFYLILYLLLNIAYSFGLKEKSVLDVMILSSGFLIRILYGGFLLNIEVSHWLFLTILAGSLYMAVGKRRNELKKSGSTTREVLKYYSQEFLNYNLYMFLTLTLVFFSLWTTSISNQYMIYIIPFVLMWCMKYNLNIDSEESTGDPVEVIIGDKLLFVSLIGIGMLFVIILYIL